MHLLLFTAAVMRGFWKKEDSLFGEKRGVGSEV